MNLPNTTQNKPSPPPLYPWNAPFQVPELHVAQIAQTVPQGTMPLGPSLARFSYMHSMQTPSQSTTEGSWQYGNVGDNSFGHTYDLSGPATVGFLETAAQAGWYPKPASPSHDQPSDRGCYNGYMATPTCSFDNDPSLNSGQFSSRKRCSEEGGLSVSGQSASKKPRSKFRPERLEQTNNVRKIGSCRRCRIMKMRVSTLEASIPAAVAYCRL